MRTHLPTVLWALLIAVGLLTSGPSLHRVGEPPAWLPATAHFVLFLVLTVLMSRSLRAAGARRPVATAAVASFLYGCVLELAQIPIEGRGLEGIDLLLDGLGAATGAAGLTLPSQAR